MIKSIIFDLDDTLYPERDYVVSGFAEVADHLAFDSGRSGEEIWRWMVDRFDVMGREKILDATLSWLGLPAEPNHIEALVEIYRAHDPSIILDDAVKLMLDRLSQTYRLAVVTDGLGAMQRRKVLALGLYDQIETIIYCWELQAPKPSVIGYRAAMSALGSEASNSLIVGDRPDHDLVAASKLGAPAVRVCSGRFAEVEAEPEVAALVDLESVVDLEKMLPELDRRIEQASKEQ